MKITITFSSLLLLFLLLTNVRIEAAIIQQSVPTEKKREMHRLDPSDIFSEAKESSTANRKNSRKSQRRQSNVTNEAETATIDMPTPTPDSMAAAASSTPSATQTQASEPVGSPTPLAVVGETGWYTQPASKGGLEATNASLSTLPSNSHTSNALLPLPVVITLFVLVLATLIFVFVKMVRNIRGQVN